MVYFVLDTNIWLYLANGLDNLTNKYQASHHFTLLKTLEDLIDKREISVLVNDIIISEWYRNKDHAYEQIEKLKKQSAASENVLRQAKLAGGGTIDAEVEKVAKVLKENCQRLIDLNSQHIERVDHFINRRCTKIGVSEALKIKIFDLSVSQKAPFHIKKTISLMQPYC